MVAQEEAKDAGEAAAAAVMVGPVLERSMQRKQ